MNLSIIIPTLNEADYLASTIENLRQSSSSDYEIIVIDSGSSDLTREIAGTLGVKLINYKGEDYDLYALINDAFIGKRSSLVSLCLRQARRSCAPF